MNFPLIVHKSVLFSGGVGRGLTAMLELEVLFRMSLDNKKVHKKIVLLLPARKVFRIFAVPFTQPLFRIIIDNIFMLPQWKQGGIFVLIF